MEFSQDMKSAVLIVSRRFCIGIWFHSPPVHRSANRRRWAPIDNWLVSSEKMRHIRTGPWLRWNKPDDRGPIPSLPYRQCIHRVSTHFQFDWTKPRRWSLQQLRRRFCTAPHHPAALIDSMPLTRQCSIDRLAAVCPPVFRNMYFGPLSPHSFYYHRRFLLFVASSTAARFCGWNEKRKIILRRSYRTVVSSTLHIVRISRRRYILIIWWPYFRCHGSFPLKPIPILSHAAAIRLNFFEGIASSLLIFRIDPLQVLNLLHLLNICLDIHIHIYLKSMGFFLIVIRVRLAPSIR